MEALSNARFASTLPQPIDPKTITCPEHGDYLATGVRLRGGRDVWSKCPGCAEKEKAEERAAFLRERNMIENMRRAEVIRESRLPARLAGCNFSNYIAATDQQKHAMQVAMDFANNFEKLSENGETLIFAGLPGTGKGHLAASVMNKLMPDRLPIYTTCMDLIRSVRDTWRKDSRASETDVLYEYERVALLIVDEIGVQYGTDGEQTILFDVVDRRYRQMKPSIFITNQDRAGFTQFLGERAYDRLRQTARWVPFDWESYRPQARKVAQ
jgi:DNA replication protein DnaC